MTKQICTKCGYEGRGKRLGERKGGGAFRLLGMLTLLPVFSLWRLSGGSGGKYCRHCELPSMVKIKSNAGRQAKHMMDVELGVIQVRKNDAAAVESPVNLGIYEQERTKKIIDPEKW